MVAPRKEGIFSFGITRYYSQNNIGSTTLLTNNNGEDIGQFLYTPFGEMWVDEASTVDISHITRFFTNQQYDKESGLYYYNARYYDPHLGSFITPDPAMDGINHYAYANSNPVRYSDPTGLVTESEAQDQWESEGCPGSFADWCGDINGVSISEECAGVPDISGDSWDSEARAQWDLEGRPDTFEEWMHDPEALEQWHNEGCPDTFEEWCYGRDNVEPTIFTQNQFDDMFDFGKGADNKACALTVLLNYISREYTKQTNKAMTLDQAKSLITKSIITETLGKNAYVTHGGKLLNEMWDMIKNDHAGVTGKWVDMGDRKALENKYGSIKDDWYGYFKTDGIGHDFHILGSGINKEFYDPYTGKETNKAPDPLYMEYYYEFRK